MLTLTTNRNHLSGMTFWKPFHDLLTRWTEASPAVPSVRAEEPTFVARESDQVAHTQSKSQQGQATRTRVKRTNAQIEALELALRQGSVNAPSELFT